MKAMAEAGSVGVILPTTAYILRLKHPPVRAMLDNGMIVALGSDFNPNAHCVSMPIVMHLACVNLRLSLNEALAAATINSAHSLGRSRTHGSIEVMPRLPTRGQLSLLILAGWQGGGSDHSQREEVGARGLPVRAAGCHQECYQGGGSRRLTDRKSDLEK